MPIDALSDSRLIRRSQQGDRDAFVALARRYDHRLRGLAYALTVDEQAMARTLRTAYLKAWRDVVRADPDDDAGTWLYRLVYNACIDELRREGAPRALAPEGGDPLAGALSALAPEERVALVMVDREGFTPAATARILGIAEDTVLARLAAARAAVLAAVPPAPDRPRRRPPERRRRPVAPPPPTPAAPLPADNQSGSVSG